MSQQQQLLHTLNSQHFRTHYKFYFETSKNHKLYVCHISSSLFCFLKVPLGTLSHDPEGSRVNKALPYLATVSQALY